MSFLRFFLALNLTIQSNTSLLEIRIRIRNMCNVACICEARLHNYSPFLLCQGEALHIYTCLRYLWGIKFKTHNCQMVIKDWGSGEKLGCILDLGIKCIAMVIELVGAVTKWGNIEKKERRVPGQSFGEHLPYHHHHQPWAFIKPLLHAEHYVLEI